MTRARDLARIANSNALTVDSSGNVGIGSTIPTSLLHLSSTTAPQLNVQSPASGGADSQLRISSSAGNYRRIIFYDSAATPTKNNFEIAVQEVNNSLFFGPSTAVGGLTFSGSTGLVIDSSGRLLVGTSSGNANGGILQLSSGITFPATAVAASDANTLDDYEEGTFTYTVNAGGTNLTSSGGTYTAYYTKIGNLVNLQGGIAQIITKSAATGDITITGLPFTSAQQAAVYISALQDISFADFPSSRIGGGTAIIDFYETTNAGVRTTLTDANWSNNGFLTWSTSLQGLIACLKQARNWLKTNLNQFQPEVDPNGIH